MSGPSLESRPTTFDGLRRAGLGAWAILGILLLVAVGLLLLYQIRVIFPPLVLALVLIYLLNPVVTRLQRARIPRWLGTIAIYLLFIGTLVAVISLLVPPMQDQLSDLGKRLPELRQDATRAVEQLAGKLGPSIRKDVGQIADAVQTEIISGAGQLARFGLGALHLVLIFVLAPVLALYLLIDLPRLQRSFVDHLPARYRDEWLMLLKKCGATVGGFFRGQLLVALVVGALSSVALAVIGIPFWLPIGMLVGFFNIIPFVGPVLGGAVAVIVAAVDGGLSRALLAAGAMLLVQQTDNHLISPKIMGRALKLHPVTVILALLAGGTLAGLWGMLIAVPATGVAKVLLTHYYSTHVLGEPRAPASPQPPGGAVLPDLAEAQQEFAADAPEAQQEFATAPEAQEELAAGGVRRQDDLAPEAPRTQQEITSV